MPRKKNYKSKKCAAKSKQSGERCRRWARPGHSVCHMHGAKAGAPKGNKNRLLHGIYERITREKLTEREQAVFDAITADPDLTNEMRVLRFTLLRLLEPIERQAVVGTPDGAQVVSLEVDEITKAYAIEKLVDGIRKLAKELGGSETERFEQLLEALITPLPDTAD